MSKFDMVRIAQPEQEPIYQYQLANGSWIDQAKESHDYNVKHGQAIVRVLYAATVVQPVKPTQAMLRAATKYSAGCGLSGEIPSGKGYYEAMMAAQIYHQEQPKSDHHE